jgi:hypothetical protein
MIEKIVMYFKWRKFLALYAFITLFAWSVTSSPDWLIILLTFLPAVFFLFIGRTIVPLRITFCILAIFFIVNTTATKNPLLFPIAYKGTLTYSERFSHIGDSIYADEDPHPKSNQLVVSPCIRNYQTPYAVPGVSYPVEVIREVVVLSDVVPAHGTEFVVYPKYGVEPFFNIVTREIFDHSYSSQYLPDDINYFSQCVKYNKPLVFPWVVIIEKLFTPLVIFSYIMLGIILIGFCIKRIILFFYNKNLP